MSMRAVLFVRNIRKPQPITILVKGSPKKVPLISFDKQVFDKIATYISLDSERKAWPSIRTLAEDCWASERRIQRSLSRLEKAKLLHRECGGGLKTTTYRIVGFSPVPGTSVPPEAARQPARGGEGEQRHASLAPPPVPPPQKPEAPPASPVTPPPVMRDTHPPSPVTPPYKEDSEGPCERTLKGEINPPPKTLAAQVLHEQCLPKVLLPAVEEAITNEARYRHIEPAAAARLISDWCGAAQANGEPVDKFAIEDRRWRNHGGRRISPTEDRAFKSRSIITGVVSAVLNRRDGHNGSIFQNYSPSLHS